MRAKPTMRARLQRAAPVAIPGAFLVAALASSAVASAETPSQVIQRLQSEGYTVTIDKIGTAPLDQCQVTSIRNPNQVSQLVPYVGPVLGGGSRDGTLLVPRVVSQTVNVSLDCSR